MAHGVGADEDDEVERGQCLEARQQIAALRMFDDAQTGQTMRHGALGSKQTAQSARLLLRPRHQHADACKRKGLHARRARVRRSDV